MHKGCETGPPDYSPYPRRLEILTICWCNNKGSTFYSVILRPWVLVWPESNSRPPASQPEAQPTEPTELVFREHFFFYLSNSIVSFTFNSGSDKINKIIYWTFWSETWLENLPSCSEMTSPITELAPNIGCLTCVKNIVLLDNTNKDYTIHEVYISSKQ